MVKGSTTQADENEGERKFGSSDNLVTDGLDVVNLTISEDKANCELLVFLGDFRELEFSLVYHFFYHRTQIARATFLNFFHSVLVSV